VVGVVKEAEKRLETGSEREKSGSSAKGKAKDSTQKDFNHRRRRLCVGHHRSAGHILLCAEENLTGSAGTGNGAKNGGLIA
jgi:hypothetical protein